MMMDSLAGRRGSSSRKAMVGIHISSPMVSLALFLQDVKKTYLPPNGTACQVCLPPPPASEAPATVAVATTSQPADDLPCLAVQGGEGEAGGPDSLQISAHASGLVRKEPVVSSSVVASGVCVQPCVGSAPAVLLLLPGLASAPPQFSSQHTVSGLRSLCTASCRPAILMHYCPVRSSPAGGLHDHLRGVLPCGGGAGPTAVHNSGTRSASRACRSRPGRACSSWELSSSCL